MAKGLDALIEHLLAEIALCGSRGATSADFRRFVAKFYARDSDTFSEAPPPPSHLHLEPTFLSSVWAWLISHRDVRILHNDNPAVLTLAEFESREIPEEPGEADEMTATQLAFHAEPSSSADDASPAKLKPPARGSGSPLSEILHQQLAIEEDVLPPGATPIDPTTSSALAAANPVPGRQDVASTSTSQMQMPPKLKVPVTASGRPVSRGCPDLAEGKPKDPRVTAFVRCTAPGVMLTDPVFPKPGVSTKSPRIFVSQDRTWQAIAGHPVDYKKVSHMEFVLLSIIASRGAEGILQPELRRISGQDKRSVPKRTDDLAKKGYIEKKGVSALKTRTSICVHKKFVKECVFTGGGSDVRSVVSTSGKALILPNLVTYLFDLMKESRVMVINDLRQKLGISPKMTNFKGLSRAIRRLEASGFLRRVKAKIKGTSDSYANCIQLLRDPNENDFKSLSFKRKGFGASSEALPTLEEDRDGDDIMRDLELEVDHDAPAAQVSEKGDDEEVGEKVQMAPQWTPDKQLGHLIYRAVQIGGQNGSNSRILRAYAMGPFWRRPLEVLVCRLTDNWERTQPKYLIHLAIIRDTTVTNELKFVHYIYRTHGNFQKAVDAGETSWEAVSKEAAGQKTSKQTTSTQKTSKQTRYKQTTSKPTTKRGRPKKVPVKQYDEPDSLGFSILPADAFLVENGTTTLRDARRVIRTEPSKENWDKGLLKRFGFTKNVNVPTMPGDEGAHKQTVKYKRRNAGHAVANARRAANAKGTQNRQGALLSMDERAALGLSIKGRLKKDTEDQIRNHFARGGTVEELIQAHQDGKNLGALQPFEVTEVTPNNTSFCIPNPPEPPKPQPNSVASSGLLSQTPRKPSNVASVPPQSPRPEPSTTEASLPPQAQNPQPRNVASSLAPKTPQPRHGAVEASASRVVVDGPQTAPKQSAKRPTTLLSAEQRAALGLPIKGRLKKEIEDRVRNHVAGGGTIEDYVLAHQTGPSLGTLQTLSISDIGPSTPESQLPPQTLPTTAEASATPIGIVTEPQVSRRETRKRKSAAQNEMTGESVTPPKEPDVRFTPGLFTPEQRMALGISARGRLKKNVEEELRDHVASGGAVEDYVLTRQLQANTGTLQPSASSLLPLQSRSGSAELSAASSTVIRQPETIAEHVDSPSASAKRKTPLSADSKGNASKRIRLSATASSAVPQSPAGATAEQSLPSDKKRSAPADSEVSTPKNPRVAAEPVVADPETNHRTGQTATGENDLHVLPSVESGPIPYLSLNTTAVSKRANTVEPARIDNLPRKEQRAVRNLREKYDNRTEPGVYCNPYMTRKVGRGRPRRAFMVVFKSDRLRENSWFKAASPPPGPPVRPTAKTGRLVLAESMATNALPSQRKRIEKAVFTNLVSRSVQFNYGLGRKTSTPKQQTPHPAATLSSAPETSVIDTTEEHPTSPPYIVPSGANQQDDTQRETTHREDTAREDSQRDESRRDDTLRDDTPREDTPREASVQIASQENDIQQEAIQEQPDEAPDAFVTENEVQNDASTGIETSSTPRPTAPSAIVSSASTGNDNDPEITVLQEKPQLKLNTISKRGVILGRGFYHLLRTEIFMELFKRCNGVFPGNGEIYEPFYTLWSKRAPKNANQPDKGTLIKNVKKLIDNGSLKLLAFTMQTTYGLPITKRILALPEINPTSEVVRSLRKNLMEHHNQRWFPEEVKDLVAEVDDRGHYPKEDVEVQPLLAEKRLEERIAASTDARMQAERDRRARQAEQRKQGGSGLWGPRLDSLTVHRVRNVVGYVDYEIGDVEAEESSSVSSDSGDEVDENLDRFRFVDDPPAMPPREDTDMTDDPSESSSESDLDTDEDVSDVSSQASARPTAVSVKGRRKRQAVSLEVIELTPAQIEQLYKTTPGTIDSDGWEHLSPAIFDKDYEWAQETSLVKPDIHFHSSNGTFSTEFSFRRNARTDLWVDPCRVIPKTLQEINLLGLGRNPLDAVQFSHEKWWLEDPVHRQFWQNVHNIEAWEEQFFGFPSDFIHRWKPSDPFINLTFPGKQVTAPPEPTKDRQKWVFSAKCVSAPFTLKVKGPVQPKNPGRHPKIVLVENERGELVPEPPRTRRRGPNKPKLKPKPAVAPPPLTPAEENTKFVNGLKIRELQDAYKEQHRRTTDPTPAERLTGLTGDVNIRARGTRPNVYKPKVAKTAGNKRKEPERKPIEHDQFKMLFYTLVIAAAMLDTPGDDLDWKIVEATYKQHKTPVDLEHARKMWSFLNKNWTEQVESLTADFQDKFLAAYEEERLPAMDDMNNYEWLKVVEWAMKNCRFPETPLPRKIEDFCDDWNITEDSSRRFNREEWYKMNFPAYVKEFHILQYRYACPVHGPETVEPPDEDGARARSWLRSNCATPAHIYNGELAHTKLMKLGTHTIDKTLENLLDRKILRSVKGAKVVPGRNFDFTSTSAHDFRRTLDFDDFMDAVGFKKVLDAAFMNPDPAKRYLTILPNAKDGTVMVLSMLVANQRVEIVPRLPPVNNKFNAEFPRLSVWGFIERDYRSRYLDRRHLEWPMDIIPTEHYRFGNPLADHYAPGTQGWDSLPPPPLPDQSDPMAPIPTWVAIDGKTIIWAWWERVLNVVLQAILFQAGTNAYDIHLVSNRAIELFEVELCVQWLEDVGAVTSTRGGKGHYIVTENWWCVFGDRLRQEKDWFGEVVKRKPVPYGQGWRYAAQTRDASWIGRRRGKKPKPFLEPEMVQMQMLQRANVNGAGDSVPPGVSGVALVQGGGDVQMGGVEESASGARIAQEQEHVAMSGMESGTSTPAEAGCTG